MAAKVAMKIYYFLTPT